MSKVIDIIRAALESLRIPDANAAIDVNDAASAINALNSMMRGWEVEGISLGWSDIADGTDAMPTPPEADEAIGANLAIRLAPRYGTNPDAALIAMAANGTSLMRAMVASTDYSRCTYPDLPRGDGQRPGSSWRDAFYR